MPIQDAKFVKTVESNAPKKGMKITWVDDRYDTIFNDDWVKLCKQAVGGNRLVEFEKEKNEAGYWKITELKLGELSTPEPAPEKPQAQTDKMNKNDWDKKDKIRQDSIETQTRMKIISELWIADKIKDNDTEVLLLRVWLTTGAHAVEEKQDELFKE